LGGASEAVVGLRARDQEDLIFGRSRPVIGDGVVRLPVKMHRPSPLTCLSGMVVH
jgi:hypothetical protein